MAEKTNYDRKLSFLCQKFHQGKNEQCQKINQNEWNKQNMKRVVAVYNSDFVDQFKSACKKLGIPQSEGIRKAMEETIRKAE